MQDTVMLTKQQKLLSERIKVAVSQNTLIHNLKSTKARSRFIQEAALNVNIYKYTPSNFLELVEDNQPQKYPEMFEEYRDFKDKEAARLEYEKWLNEERMIKTNRNMAGNLALTFLFKDQDLHEIIRFKKGGVGGAAGQEDTQSIAGSSDNRRSSKIVTEGAVSRADPREKMGGADLISKEEYERKSAKFRKPNGEEMQAHEVPGYYIKKVKYNVKTVNDFINKLRRTSVCDKFFLQNEPDFCGLKQLFQKLFDTTRQALREDKQLAGNEDELDHNMVEISNFVMYNLHSEFFYNPEMSFEEKAFQRKLAVLEKLPSKAFGIEIEDNMRHAWKMAIKEASRLQEQQTPRGKLLQLHKVMKIIEHSYALYKDSEQITADHLVSIIPYILVKAKIDRLLSHYNYIMAFHYSLNQGDIISVVQINLQIAITRLMSDEFNELIKSIDPNFFTKEKQLEAKYQLKRQSRNGKRSSRSSTEEEHKTDASTGISEMRKTQSCGSSGGNLTPRGENAVKRKTAVANPSGLHQIMEEMEHDG